MKQVADFAYLTEQIAFLCGLWNGLVDFVAGIFKFLGLLLQAPYDMAENFQDVLEAIDHFREAWAVFSFKDFFITGMRLYADILVELFQFFTDPNVRDNYNFDVIAYYSGFGVAFIASFFIPVVNITKVSNVTKFSKFIPEEFVATLNVARTQNLKGFKAMVRLLEDIAEFLSKKGDELYQELKKLLDKLLAWIKKNKKRFENEDVNINKYLKKSRVVRFRATKMLKQYIGEETGKGWCMPNKVKYLNEAERAKYELAIVNGKFYTVNGKLFDTSHTKSLFTKSKAIFVMTEDGRIYASTYHYAGVFHHSSFLSGKPVASAGELEIIEGILKEVTNKSGHYKPSKSFNNQFLKLIKNEGVNIDDVIITNIK